MANQTIVNAKGAAKALGASTDPSSFGYKMRRKRMELLLRQFPDFREMRIVDLGGDTRYWHTMEIRPAHVTIVSIAEHGVGDPEPWMRTVVGDACDPDVCGGRTFDLAFSNSVIEHVGGIKPQTEFAENVRRLAPRHWVQTPWRYFPLDPHLKFPYYQSLPLAMRAQIAKHWPLSYINGRQDDRTPVEYALQQDLLSMTEMRHLFPESTILRERLLGLTKSMIAVRS